MRYILAALILTQLAAPLMAGDEPGELRAGADDAAMSVPGDMPLAGPPAVTPGSVLPDVAAFGVLPSLPGVAQPAAETVVAEQRRATESRRRVVLKEAHAALARRAELTGEVQAMTQRVQDDLRRSETAGSGQEQATAGAQAAMTGLYDGALKDIERNSSHFAYGGAATVIAAHGRLYSVGTGVGGASARPLGDHEGYVLHGPAIYHRGRALETRQRGSEFDEYGNGKWGAPQPLPNHAPVQAKDKKGNTYYSLPDGVYMVPGNPRGQGWVRAAFPQLESPGVHIAKLRVDESAQILEVSFEAADSAQAPEPVSMRLDGSPLPPEAPARTPQEGAAHWATMAHHLASSYFSAGDPRAWTQAVDHVRYLLQAGKIEEARGAVQGYLEGLRGFPGLKDSDRKLIESALTNLQRQLDDRPDAAADGQTAP